MIDFDHIKRTLDGVPRVSQNVIDERREAMTVLLRDRAYLPIGELCKRFQISEATARRDLEALSRQKSIVRTFGGAMADYDRRFAPFAERLKVAAAAKARIAAAAVRMIEPGMTIFLDAGTTLFTVADQLRKRAIAVQVVTNSLAVAEKLAHASHVDVDLIGGRLLPNQAVLLGDVTARAAAFYRFDLALLGAEAFDAQGVWNSAANVVELQLAVMAQADRHALCLDGRKLGRSGPELLAAWDAVDLLICDLPLNEASDAGVAMDDEHYVQA
jgi:DeoR/GlpR family transcriptional regulator of sugar metabolism